MIKTTLICTCAGLLLLTVTFIIHVVAMAYPRWKIYENREKKNQVMLIGIFHRCENYQRNFTMLKQLSRTDLVCADNKYMSNLNKVCTDKLESLHNISKQTICTADQTDCDCDYSSIGKGLIACTIISAITIGLSLILIFSHILINEFKFKIHIYVVILTLCLLFLAFLFVLVTLILLGSTMAYDLHQYPYDLDYLHHKSNDTSDRTNLTETIIQKAAKNYEIRLDWSGVLEIIALVFLGFTIVTQFIYLLFTYQHRIG